MTKRDSRGYSFISVLGHFNANCSLMYTDHFGSHFKLLSHAGILRGESGRGRKKPNFLNLHSTITENMPQTTPWNHKYPLDPFLSPGFFPGSTKALPYIVINHRFAVVGFFVVMIFITAAYLRADDVIQVTGL